MARFQHFRSALHLDRLAQGWAHLFLSVEDPGRVPGWDAVLLTAASPQQAELYSAQLEAARRRGRLGLRTPALVVPDPEGRRIGSGGATLNALRAAAQVLGARDFPRRRLLLIHAGGDSRRMPWANILGKPFIPFPLLADPDHAVPALLDHLLAVSAPLAAGLKRGGLLALAGDVLPLFSNAQLRLPEDGAAVVTVPVPLDVAARHGVVVSDSEGRVTDLLQKAQPEELAAASALVSGGAAPLDTGVYAFGGRAFAKLAGMALSEPNPVGELLARGQEASLYEEVAAALTPARHAWLAARPLGPRLLAALQDEALFEARDPELAFVHLGATAELLAELGRSWHGRLARRILAESGGAVADSALLYHSRLASGARVGAGTLVYACRLGSGARLGNRCVALGVDDARPFRLPDNCCLWQAPLRDGALVTACCGVDDNPKDALESASFGNRSLAEWLNAHSVRPEELWRPGEPRDLWHARLFPSESRASGPQLAAWLLAGEGGGELREEWRSAARWSLAGLHLALDPQAWLRRHQALTDALVLSALDEVLEFGLDRDVRTLTAQVEASALRAKAAAFQAPRAAPPAAVAPPSRALQVQADLLSAAGCEAEGRGAAGRAFAAVRAEVAAALPAQATEPVAGLPAGRTARVELPARFDFAGGWSDTPPYCLERPAAVLNMAMELDGVRPIGAEVEALAEPIWELMLDDQHRRATVRRSAELSPAPSLDDPFALPRAALELCGYGGPERLTQGVRVRTWSRAPRGSGLGASSILGAALVRGLQRLAGRADDVAAVSSLVLLLEQRLTTGGGWQDQVGGLVGGVKCIRSLPVRPLRLRIEATPLRPETVADLERRLVVAFTGQARLAKNVLQIVVERYLRRDGRLLAAIRRLVELADEGRAALALGDLDDLGRVMDEAWHLHQHLDPHCSNPEVDALMAGVSDLARGAKLAGAGGGGFLGVMAKDAEAAGRIAKRLTELSGQIRVYNWSLSRR